MSGLIYGLIRNKKRKLFKLLSLPDSSEGVKMKSKLACGLIVLVLFSMSVFASVDSAPPAIPSEYWGTVTLDGAPAGDGLAVTAEVGGTNTVHSWSIGFFPYENPRVAFAVLMESGPRQNTVGATYVATQVIRWIADTGFLSKLDNDILPK